jgi:iron(III) transport system substrate-binding protein
VPELRTTGLLIAVLLTLSGTLGWAQDAGLEAARKEGKVVWYTVGALPMVERVAKLFEQGHPGIKVEVHRSGSERILQRFMQEAAAGIKTCDVLESADAGHFVVLKKKGFLSRYLPPGADRFPPAFRDPDGMGFGWRAHLVVIPYNAKLLPASEAPRTWKDLLDPKWKGKLVTAHPGYSGTIVSHIHALANLYGWDYWKQMAQQRPLLVQSAQDPMQVVGAGERLVGVNASEYTLYIQRKKGNPLGIVYPQDGVPLIVTPTGITSFAPHPNAARRFIDFLFTREIQQYLVEHEGLYVPHPEVTYPSDKPRLSDLKLLAIDPVELERRTDEIKKRFVELFGA